MKKIITRIKTFIRMSISPNTLRAIKKLFGRYQIDEVDMIHKYLRNKIHNKLMIDVGAHYGESFSNFLYHDWLVYAFEPDSENYKELEVISKNKHNLILDQRGCSNKSMDNVNFYNSDISSGISSLSAFDSSHKNSAKITTVTIGDFIKEKTIKEIGFLKIDVEGYDLFVLQGVPWNIIKPEVIVVEYEDRKTKKLGYDYHDLAQILIDNGYTVLLSQWHPIERYGVKHKWRALTQYPCDLIDSDGWGNILAFQDNKLAEIIKGKNWTKTEAFN